MAVATCSNCGNHFAGTTYFDMHQDADYADWDHDRGVVCLDPRDVGLVINDRGRWTDPDKGYDYTPVSGLKQLTCSDCGVQWEVERSRGRYPSKCGDCA